MARKAKTEEPAKQDPDQLRIDATRYITKDEAAKLAAATNDQEHQAEVNAISCKVMAKAMTNPEVRAARTIHKFDGAGLDITAAADELREMVEEVRSGNMQRPEAMLVSQAHALDALFSSLAMRSHANAKEGYIDASDRYMRLAFKAQAQAVRTIEALGELKNPRPVAYVRNANIATNQQINNHSPQAGENQKSTDQTISGGSYELLENTRTQGIEGAVNPSVAALETINRA